MKYRIWAFPVVRMKLDIEADSVEEAKDKAQRINYHKLLDDFDRECSVEWAEDEVQVVCGGPIIGEL